MPRQSEGPARAGRSAAPAGASRANAPITVVTAVIDAATDTTDLRMFGVFMVFSCLVGLFWCGHGWASGDNQWLTPTRGTSVASSGAQVGTLLERLNSQSESQPAPMAIVRSPRSSAASGTNARSETGTAPTA